MANFQVAPGVQVKEIDLTNVIPAVSASTGGFVGDFNWGPVDEVTLVSSEKVMADMFGKPSVTKAVDFLTAAQFLSYANSLRVVRVIDNVAQNATSDNPTTRVVIKNRDAYDALDGTFSSDVSVTVAAPAASGDSLVALDSVAGLTVGDVVSGTGVNAGTTITAINGVANTITLSETLTGSLSASDVLSVAVYKGAWAAKYPGALGNSLRVEVCTAGAAFATWDLRSIFTVAPGTSTYAEARGGSNDEVHVVVIDEDGRFTGTAGAVLERFDFLSQARDAKSAEGASLYYKEVINRSSKYVWFLDHDPALTSAGQLAQGVAFATSATILNYSLVGGADTAVVPQGAYELGFDLFSDTETIDVSLLFQPAAADHTLSNKVIAIAEARKDCVAFVSPPLQASVQSTDKLTDVLAWGNLVMSSSYGFMDSSAIKVYDKYNDQYLWVPASGSTAGLAANTDDIADPWFSPAGFNRGQYRNVAKVAFNPNATQRDDLYSARINPIVSFSGEGTVLYGDKTTLAKPSAFDRINVRRLFIVLEKAIATAAKFQLFEFNDDYTRTTFRNAVEPFLRNVQSRRGLTDFRVVCDTTNNTPDVIDTNGFVADIYIKPARSINFITLNFIATRTGVDFSEIAG